MNLHIFNPEHDIALATNLANFTAPHAGRQLRHDLGFIPALWAKEGDVVLVDDEDLSVRSYERIMHQMKCHLGELRGGMPVSSPRFLQLKRGQALPSFPEPLRAVSPWGWDMALKYRLQRAGLAELVLPADAQLAAVRQLSHRRTSAALLPQLRCDRTVGESFECQSVEEVEALVSRYDHVVLKAPWSSSGRGLRFVERSSPVAQLSGWLRNLLASQGSVMVEPFYNKVKDFGMEFCCSSDGHVSYVGLSLFHTSNGAYTGNVLATESVKRDILNRYIPICLVDDVRDMICNCLPALLHGQYEGPLGIDMMVVNGADGALLHPCVEINLRRTMGHVALALPPTDDDIQRAMRIEYQDNRYKLNIVRI